MEEEDGYYILSSPKLKQVVNSIQGAQSHEC